jgi:ABC-type transporter Mla subunit MlaD
MESQQTLLVIMAVFTGVAAVALLLQMVFLFGIYRSVKALKERSMLFLDRWEPVADSSLKTLEQLREQSGEILGKLSDLADATKVQSEKVDSILDDVSTFSKTQLSRVDQTVAGALEKVNETTATLQKTLLAPVRQIRALATALSAIVESLFGARRQNVDRATIDEEMFI